MSSQYQTTSASTSSTDCCPHFGHSPPRSAPTPSRATKYRPLALASPSKIPKSNWNLIIYHTALSALHMVCLLTHGQSANSNITEIPTALVYSRELYTFGPEISFLLPTILQERRCLLDSCHEIICLPTFSEHTGRASLPRQ